MKKQLFLNGFLLTALLLFAGSISVIAQDQLSLRDRADKLFSEFQYSKAAAIYVKITDDKSPKLKDMERLAQCYAKMNRYEDAEIWYARVVADKQSTPDNLLKYGEILKANALYTKAKKVLQEYVTKTGKVEQVAVSILGCDSALIWMARPTSHKLKNEAAVNTENSEFSVFAMGDKVYYTGEPKNTDFNKTYGWTGNSFLKVHTATRATDNTLSTPALASSDINSEAYHIGPISGNKSGDMYFITRTYPGKKGVIKKDSRGVYLTNNMELYFQANVYGKWQAPIAFAYNNVKEYSVGHAAISVDGKTLYFVSDMAGGQGGTDIWYCDLQSDGSWGKCLNAGPVVNSKGDELFPSIASDGMLYFSTNGQPGMGGMDIFKSKGAKDNWSKPQNMRYPLNSAGDDFAFTINDSKTGGYFASNRKNGKGSDDIYSFSQPKPKTLHFLKGTVYQKQTKARIPEASVTLMNGIAIVAKQDTKVDGTVLFQLDEPTTYNIQAAKDSYYADSANVTIRESEITDTTRVSLYLDQLFEKGKTIRIENIHYNFDKDDIRADAAIILDKVVQALHANPSIKIELSSHTDSRGTAEYNENLSQRRAQSAVNYLVTRGIARSRMVAKGYGENRLLNKCKDGVECTDDEHQTNRRTEFTVLEY
jgi:outer membrane protein OmpA-like peptidoglycan-associated protein/tetratricopeptide (TPR) repeat protein